MSNFDSPLSKDKQSNPDNDRTINYSIATINCSTADDSFDIEVYPSADILLAMIQSEYNIEASRKRDIETRTGVLIAFLGALIGFYATAVDFSIFKKATSSMEYFGFIFLAIIYISPFLMFILSMRNFLKVLQTKTYQSISTDGISKEIAEKPKDEVAFKLAETYKLAVIDNEKANNEKAYQFRKGIFFMYISLIFIIIAFILKQIVSLVL